LAAAFLAVPAGAEPNLGLPNPTIETIMPFLFFLKARSFLQTSPPLRWLPLGSPEVLPSMHHTVPSPLSATTIPT